MRFYLVLFIFLLNSCSSVPKLNEFELDSNYRHRHYDLVIKPMENRLKQTSLKDKESLLHRLNLAIVYQSAGKFKESNKVLMEAKELMDWNEYISISEKTKSFIFGEGVEKFRLEDHEQLLVQAYIALNFAYDKNYDSALVEAKDLDLSLRQFKQVHPEFDYSKTYYVSYLSGVFYEANKKFDEAYIDYERVYTLNPNFPYLGYDLYRTAFYSGQLEKAKKWAKEYNISQQYLKFISSKEYFSQGELVIVYQNGSAPFKVPHPYWGGVVAYQSRINGAERAQILINNEEYGVTYDFFNIEKLVSNLFASRYQKQFKRDIARSVMKEAVALPLDLISGGFIGSVATRVALHSSTNLDLRSWDYLPRDIQISRIILPPGVHEVHLVYNNERGDFEKKKITIKKGQKTLVPFQFANTY